MHGNALFEGLDATLVKRLSEQPEILADANALKASNASFAYAPAQAQTLEGRPRTPVNEPLPAEIVSVLNLALLAEYLETEFYSRGLNTPGLIPTELRQTFVRILLNETAQREIILGVLGERAITKPSFDYTAGGELPDPFANFNAFAGLGQTFEDFGTRVYKGQAPNVQSNDFVLTTALRFHSVEARHAAEIRLIRRQLGFDSIKPWITLRNRGTLPAAAQFYYNGEENVVQGGINLTTLINPVTGTNFSAETVSEAFDEPVTRQEALNGFSPFIAR